MQLASSFQVDHVVPLFDGGKNTESNLQALCANCHSAKTQREAIERADRLYKQKENERRQLAIDSREDRVVTRQIGGGETIRMLQCQSCYECRSLDKGWETHRCAALKPPTKSLTVYTFSAVSGGLASPNRVDIEVEGAQ